MDVPREHVSLWIATAPGPSFPPLSGDVSVDVAVIGGGIAGITAATLLKRAGKTVAVVESRRLVRGVTGHTTAKVTSNHGMIYADLLDQLGRDSSSSWRARGIGQARTSAATNGTGGWKSSRANVLA